MGEPELEKDLGAKAEAGEAGAGNPEAGLSALQAQHSPEKMAALHEKTEKFSSKARETLAAIRGLNVDGPDLLETLRASGASEETLAQMQAAVDQISASLKAIDSAMDPVYEMAGNVEKVHNAVSGQRRYRGDEKF